MKINLFIARTPLQLFNCIEAKKRFHEGDKNILFYQYQRDVDKKQIERLIEMDRWEKVIAYPLTRMRKRFFPFYLKNIITQYQSKISHCYYGTYNNIISSLINLIKPYALILIDDGTKTLVHAQLIESKNIERRGFFKKIRNKLFSTSREFLYQSTFFSLYPLKNYNIANKVILNDYRMFKDSLSSLPSKDVVYFIGTPLGEHVLKDKLVYEEYLQKVVTYYGDKKFIYILHRYENVDEITHFAKKYHFEYVKFDTILEYAILKAGFIPKECATFSSSAIETLPLLYPQSKYTSFYVKPDDILQKKQDIMNRIYQNYEAKGYEVIHL